MSRIKWCGSLAAMIALTGLVSARADETIQQTETTTHGPQDARVMDSWMQPTVTQVKSSTDENGETKKEVAPIIMERHERVEQPLSTESQTTTVIKDSPKVVEQKSTKSCSTVHKTSYVAKPRHHQYVAHRAYLKQAIATKQTVTQQAPTVIQEHKVTERSVIMDRPDPALNQP